MVAHFLLPPSFRRGTTDVGTPELTVSIVAAKAVLRTLRKGQVSRGGFQEVAACREEWVYRTDI